MIDFKLFWGFHSEWTDIGGCRVTFMTENKVQWCSLGSSLSAWESCRSPYKKTLSFIIYCWCKIVFAWNKISVKAQHILPSYNFTRFHFQLGTNCIVTIKMTIMTGLVLLAGARAGAGWGQDCFSMLCLNSFETSPLHPITNRK